MRSASDVAASFHYSREGLAQRLVSGLVLAREPVGWNFRGVPTSEGRAYIRALDDEAFGASWPGDAVFIDEYDLPKRLGVDAKDAAPDQAVMWGDRVLVIELKTEPGSHSPGQCEWYVDLAKHRNPHRQVDLVYLTGPLRASATLQPVSGSRLVHVQWSTVDSIVQRIWAKSGVEWHRDYARLLHRLVSSLDRPWREAASLIGVPPPVEDVPGHRDDVVAAEPRGEQTTALDTARAVAADHRQRAVELTADDLEALSARRNEIAAAIDKAGIGDGHVRPWVWRRASTGSPMTRQGELTGYEIRLSWYQR